MEKQASLISYSATTNDIHITALPRFIPQESYPDRHLYAFAYTIQIENHGTELVQLLNRHWVIFSGGVQYAEVRGDGVIGEQPFLQPSEAFQYTSGCVIKDPVGSMHGEYTFISSEGGLFEVSIPRFDLIYPELIH